MVNLRIIEVLPVLAALRIVPKERLHLVGRRESNQHSAWGVANKCPSVRYLSWPENGITGFHLETLGADFGNVFTFDDVEPFILIVVQMARGATLLATGMLHDKETAAAILG